MSSRRPSAPAASATPTAPAAPAASAASSSAPRGLRARRRAETTDEIIAAALALTAREGLAALTMHRIAEEVGCVVSALYRYFDSKDALFLAVQARVLEGVSADLVEAVAGHAAAPPLARLVAALHAYQELPRRRPSEFALLQRWLGDPGFAVDTDAARAQWRLLVARFAPLVQLLEAGVADGTFSPGEARPRLYVLWGALQGALQLRRFDRLDEPGLDSSCNATATLKGLLIGFGAPALAVDEAFALVDAAQSRKR